MNSESIIPIIQAYWIQIVIIMLVTLLIKNIKAIILATAVVFSISYFGFLDFSNVDFSEIIEQVNYLIGGIEWQKLLVR